MATWNLDPAHTSAGFVARHMMVTTVRGKFNTVSGTLEFNPDKPEAARVDVTIDAASISSGVEDRDNHLRSADFLEVEQFPQITFTSKRVNVTGKNEYDVIGDLSLHGVTREVTLKTEYLGQSPSPFGDVRAGFVASAKINREDWGLTWNAALETGGVLVSKEIKLDIDVEAVLVGEAAAAG
jgi:polyisoprenoid-binding protein YceI